jgi:hypothetical protein
MGFLSQLFGAAKAQVPPSSRMHSQLSPPTTSQARASVTSTAGVQRELLKVVLRDTLNRHGIPAAWIGADMLQATSRGREPGIHLRLLIKHWEPRLLLHAVALQNNLIIRILSLDPMAPNWLMGISWQFALPDEDMCPPMPHPGSWTAQATARAPAPSQVALAGGSGDVIAGPVRIDSGTARPATTSAATRSELEQLFASRDADAGRAAGQGRHEQATEPMFLKTEPHQLERGPARAP